MAAPFKIACIGEVMIEMVTSGTDQARLGVAGDTYNTAVYLRKLASDDELEVSYVTGLGTDPFSDRILEACRFHGLGISYIEHREDRMPGLYAIRTDESGERSFFYWRGEAAARTLFAEPCKIDIKSLASFDLLYLSGITMAILPDETREKVFDFIQGYRKDGGRIAFDSNYRKRLWPDRDTAHNVTSRMWSLTDIALPSLDDETAIFDDGNEQSVLDRFRKYGITCGALKRGKNGPLAIGTTSGAVEFAAAPRIVDTTAAGDSFNAGFLYEIIKGKSLEEAMVTGHRLASKVVQAEGAIIDLGGERV